MARLEPDDAAAAGPGRGRRLGRHLLRRGAARVRVLARTGGSAMPGPEPDVPGVLAPGDRLDDHDAVPAARDRALPVPGAGRASAAGAALGCADDGAGVRAAAGSLWARPSLRPRAGWLVGSIGCLAGSQA